MINPLACHESYVHPEIPYESINLKDILNKKRVHPAEGNQEQLTY